MSLSLRLLGIAAPILLGAVRAYAQDPLDAEGCVYNREIYPEDTEMCQNGNYVRCEDGAWSDEGDCPDEAPAPPVTQGGDVVEPE